MTPRRRPKIVGAARRVNRSVSRALTRTAQYAWSSLAARRAAGTFHDVRTFCMFIGYPRSGHSLVGALIDAHPHAIIAHELNVLEYLRHGFSRMQIYTLLLRNSQRFARGGRRWTGYSYAVPNQWQGRYTTLQVIGDKKGGGTTKLLRASPPLLTRLEQLLDVPVRFVHVVRNPYDNISTIARRQGWTLEKSSEYYFGLAAANARIRERLGGGSVLDLRYEALVADPSAELERLCRFLGLTPGGEYLRDCASIVFPSPRRTRAQLSWTGTLIATVRARCDGFPWLTGYAYEG